MTKNYSSHLVETACRGSIDSSNRRILCEDQHGHVTTLGRGGSDYTASIIASCVKADEIWMMGDADGMMTADPSMVDNAKMIPEVAVF